MDAPAAVLVVVNGRQTGARHPLAGSLTLIGRAPDCDMRLNVKGVQPQHAVLVQGPDGFLVRNLTGQGVLVNGTAATLCPLDHGDLLAVGPFQFRLERTGPSPRQTAEAERDALRIQAAAVAAQQAALNEDELRLRQRRAALEKQEEQLAGHLEARRRRLREIHEQMRREREEFRGTRAAAVEEQAALRKEAQAVRDAATAMSQQVEKRRERLMRLRRRLRLRERQLWQEKEAVLNRRDKELSARDGRLRDAAAKLEQERAALVEARLRVNGDAELGKRQLRDQWQELALARQKWEACLNQERQEHRRRERALDAQGAALEEAVREWTGRERSQRLLLVGLHRESAGLETRIAHQRQKLAAEEAAVAKIQAERPTQEAPPVPATTPAALSGPPSGAGRALVLHRVAGELADQRGHLLEQWQTLLRVQEEWQQDRMHTLAGVEAAAHSLHELEQGLQVRERELAAAAADCRQRQKAQGKMRQALEGWQARLRMHEAGWDAERVSLLAQVRAREAAAAQMMKRVQEKDRRRHARLRQEETALAALRKGCDDLRQQYIGLWEECQRRRKELAQEQRGLAARLLAVEQLRAEVVGNSPGAAKAARRLERLERRYVARMAEAEQEIEDGRAALSEQVVRLEELARRVRRQQDELAARLAAASRQADAGDQGRADAEEADERRRLDFQLLCTRHDQDARLIAHLRDELENAVRQLMDEPDDAAPAAQAA